MSSHFTALPLRNGESFILETDRNDNRQVILVDGGQLKADGPSKNDLYQAIRAHCPGIEDRIDIAICTHRDHDHAGGFPAFIKTWLGEGNDIGEFWLPGAWASAVEYALTDPDRLVSMIYEGAVAAVSAIDRVQQRSGVMDADPLDVGRPQRSLRSINALLHQYRRERLHRVEPDSFKPILTDVGELSRATLAAQSWGFSLDNWRYIQNDLETSEIHAEPLLSRLEHCERLHQWPRIVRRLQIEDRKELIWHESMLEDQDAPLARTLAFGAIETAEAIRSISTAAADFDVPVRWFDFKPFEDGASPTGGEPGFLIPLNSVETKEVYREEDALTLFLKLTLTEQNVASLVFQRVETDQEPSVIFVADSRLAFGIDRPEANFPNHLVPVTRPIVYTAAHHGSRNNDRAYEVLKSWLGPLYADCLVVRNGGVWNQKLGDFLNIGNRRCAQCYQCHGGEWSQLVQINTSGQNWSWPSDQGRVCGQPKRKTKRKKSDTSSSQ